MLPSSDPQTDKLSGNFPLSSPSQIAIPLLGFLTRSRRIQSVDGLYPASGPYQGHSSADVISLIPKQLWTRFRCWNFLHSEAQLCYWDFPTLRPNSPVGISPTLRTKFPIHWWDFPYSKLMHPFCWWVTPPLQNPFKFASKHSESLCCMKHIVYIW